MIVVIVVIVVIMISLHATHEPFEDRAYSSFVAFFNPFQVRWTKAIITSFTSQDNSPTGDTQQPTAAQLNQPTAGQLQQPTAAQLNQHIAEISKKIGKPLPPITDPLPPTFQPAVFQGHAPNKAEILNALTWMNDQMETSHATLKDALNEHFEDICHQIQTCQQQQQAEQAETIHDLLGPIVDSEDIFQAWNKNQALAAKSEQIQKQAQSGELLGQLIKPSEEEKMTKPAGSNLWLDMKKNHPERAAQMEKDVPKTLIATKNWSDQVNAHL